jgi:hypothetical protein
MLSCHPSIEELRDGEVNGLASSFAVPADDPILAPIIRKQAWRNTRSVGPWMTRVCALS